MREAAITESRGGNDQRRLAGVAGSSLIFNLLEYTMKGDTMSVMMESKRNREQQKRIDHYRQMAQEFENGMKTLKREQDQWDYLEWLAAYNDLQDCLSSCLEGIIEEQHREV
jgi:hypothetical protein